VTRRLRRIVAAAGVGILLALTGCVAIPTAGPVQIAPIDTDPDDLNQVALPEGPQAGQDMAQTLVGFLRAGRAPHNNYQVAQEFLVPGTEWNGTSRVLISSTAISPVVVDEDTLSVTVNVAAEVDATGSYLVRGEQQTLLYDFRQVDGEYRISQPAQGTLLTPNGFASAFGEYPLYFFDPSFEYLVPDLRWFPETRSRADRIVKELLAGPAPWLRSGVVISAIPENTTGGARYDAPRVDVELGAGVRAESAATQRRMLQQLEASLRALGNVTPDGIVVTSEGLSLAPGAENPVPDSRYMVLPVFGGFEGTVGTLTEDGVVPLATIGTRADGLGATQASLDRERTALAVLGSGGVSLVPEGGDPLLLDPRPGLVAPTIDPYGYVWSVPADDPGGLQATAADGVVHPVPLTPGGRVISIELARDGARLLVALATPEGPRLFAAGVLRDAGLAPVALHTPFDLRATGPIIDVAWVDGTHVAVLTAAESGTPVHVLALGGPVESLGSVSDGVAIVGGNGTDGLRLLARNGIVLRPGAGNWPATVFVASFLGTQQ